MLKRLVVVLFMLIPVAAFAELSDAEAKRIAISMDSTITKAKMDLNQLIAAGARDQYKPVRETVAAALSAWPGQKLSNRAAFPYFECAEAARGFLQYGDAWVRNDQKKEWRDHVVNQFRQSDAGCKAAISNPDLSLKNIQ